MASTYNWAKQPYETASILCIRIWSTGTTAGNTLLNGLAHSSLAKIGQAGFVEAGVGGGGGETNGEQRGEEVNAAGEIRLAHKDRGNSISNVRNGKKMEAIDEDLVVQKDTNLAGVLDSLISLDLNGNFLDPLDDFSAPNYSKLIKSPMSFTVMREKILTRQYSTWRLFVEDFERICHNAMNYNKKRSIIWTAANDLLRKGRNCLEQYEKQGDTLVTVSRSLESHATTKSKSIPSAKSGSNNVDSKIDEQDTVPASQRVGMAISSAVTGQAEIKPSISQPAPIGKKAIVKEDVGVVPQSSKDERGVNNAISDQILCIALGTDGAAEERSRTSELEEGQKHVGEVPDVSPRCSIPVHEVAEWQIDVEGEGCIEPDDSHFDVGGQATECSSSFESTGSGLEGELGIDRLQLISEAESDLRDGNGAFGLQEDDDGAGTSERGKKALDADWKKARRGIEWRCHWLELRMQELQAQSVENAMSLKKLRKEKIWKLEGEVGEGTAARTVPVKILRNHPILRRRRRRRAEEAADLDAFMGRHPLFSRYDKKKRKSEDGLAGGNEDSQQNQHIQIDIQEPETMLKEDDAKEHSEAAHASVEGEQMEEVLWQVEALQARLVKVKRQLRKGAPRDKAVLPNLSPRGPNQGAKAGFTAPGVPSKVSPRGVPPTAPAGGLARGVRRRSSDYDINNVVMPGSMGAKYVGKIRHVDIETPQWRSVGEGHLAQPSHDQDSSDEDTDDEHYQNKHAIMETREREQRYMPPLKRNPDSDTVGKGHSKGGVGKAAAKMASKAKQSSGTLALPSTSTLTVPIYIPKKSRSKRRPNNPHALPGSNPAVADPPPDADPPPLVDQALAPTDVAGTSEGVLERGVSTGNSDGDASKVAGSELEDAQLKTHLALKRKERKS